MEFLNETMQRAFPKLNHYPHTFVDVQEKAKRERIKLTICDYDPNIMGYYCIRKTRKTTKKFIVINAMLDELDRTFIGLHELAHHFLHVPVNTRQWFFCKKNALRTEAKHDCEANSFALIAMIPLWRLIELDATNYEDISPELLPYCLRRKALWEKYSV